MATDGDEVRKGLSGTLYSAPVGTTLPDDTTTALAADWTDLGYLSDDGPSMSVDNSTESHTPWQALRPVRYDVTERAEMFNFPLWQRNADTLKQAFGGGTIVAGTGDDVIFTPPSGSTQFERAYVLEVRDGDIVDRYRLRRGTPSLSGDVAFNKTDVTAFELEVAVLDDSGESWDLITNDPAVEVDS